MNETMKAAAAYAVTVLLAHISARYHLSSDQTAAVAADLATAVAAIGGVWMHYTAHKSEPPK